MAERVLGGAVEKFELRQNYSNPCNRVTTIEYSLPHSGFPSLKFYNVLEEDLATPVSGDHKAGAFKATWDTSEVPSGVYLYRLSTEH